MEQQVIANVAETVMRHATAVMAGQLEEVMRDYTDGSAIITADQSFHGLEEIRQFWQALFGQFPPEVLKNITVIRQEVAGDLLYMTYKAEPVVNVGADTFLVHDGKIIVQTIFLVLHKPVFMKQQDMV
jgi:ketosteroid isomerase-like protein